VVRRHADQLVSALPTGLQSPSVKLYARFQNSAKWEEISMQPRHPAILPAAINFSLPGCRQRGVLRHCGALTSKHFNIRVTDLPL